MPEGPTIRNTADALRAALLGRRVERFHSPLKRAAAEGWLDRTTGQHVVAVRSHGKNLFVDFDNDWTLYTHMLMWGAWHVYARGEPWRKEERKARLVLTLADDPRHQRATLAQRDARRCLLDAERRAQVAKERCRLLRASLTLDGRD